MDNSFVPSDAELLALGGWDARCARVLAAAFNKNGGIAVIDTNGDGVSVEFEEFGRDADGQLHPGDSTGSGELMARYDDKGLYRAAGRTAAPGPSVIRVEDQDLNVTAAEGGWWAWVRQA
ncbi:hypothetical protein [Nocardia vaccinii]|uniref:hypothetical protein n=1 Tax=Nocardia vaccinii TaxID=1822 RepID=UPI000829A719|nr:hypothetical protein [Nocardia vaccinii]